MSRHFNSVQLIGNLVDSPELNYTSNNTAVCNYMIAVNRSYKNDDGWEEETSYIDCTVWGNDAENAEQYLSKGNRVFVGGRIDQDRWEDDNGQSQSKLKVTVNRQIFLEGNEQNVKNEDAEEILEDFDGGETDDDIPF